MLIAPPSLEGDWAEPREVRKRARDRLFVGVDGLMDLTGPQPHGDLPGHRGIRGHWDTAVFSPTENSFLRALSSRSARRKPVASKLKSQQFD